MLGSFSDNADLPNLSGRNILDKSEPQSPMQIADDAEFEAVRQKYERLKNLQEATMREESMTENERLTRMRSGGNGASMDNTNRSGNGVSAISAASAAVVVTNEKYQMKIKNQMDKISTRFEETNTRQTPQGSDKYQMKPSSKRTNPGE